VITDYKEFLFFKVDGKHESRTSYAPLYSVSVKWTLSLNRSLCDGSVKSEFNDTKMKESKILFLHIICILHLLLLNPHTIVIV